MSQIDELSFRLSSVEARLDSELGKDNQSRHPHGSRTQKATRLDLDHENLSKLFQMVTKIDARLSLIEQRLDSLRGADGVTVEKNVIRGTIPPIPNVVAATICDPTTGNETNYNLVVYP